MTQTQMQGYDERTIDDPFVCSFEEVHPQILRSPRRPADVWHSKQVGYAAIDLLERKTCTSLLNLMASEPRWHQAVLRLLSMREEKAVARCSEAEGSAGRTLLKPFLASALAMLLAWPPFRSSSRILVPLLTFFRAAIDSTVTCAPLR